MSIEAELEALRAEVARLRQEVGEQRAAFSMKRQTLRVDGKIFSFVETPDESGPYR